MIKFSIRVASVIGNFIDVPRHAHSIIFLLKSALIIPKVVVLKINKVTKDAILIFQLNKNEIPKNNSIKGYNLAYEINFFARGSYFEKLKGKVE
tara:strand:+ start:826 stop:1107 length:282 start_codon:yes stop_codon:yes gene_type:complete